MGMDRQRLTPDERANLVAYLDEELNPAEARAIATKLTHSPTARREIEVLRKTWEMLDHLPRPVTSPEFTERTLTEIRKLDEHGDALGLAVASGLRRVLAPALWVGASAVAFLLGYAVMAWAWPDPTSRLTRDLSIAEHLDEYRDVGSFEFLNELYHSPEFGPGQSE
ncbi:MAG: anti-sigma factor [Isosphaeraceae bacterium]